MRNAVPDAPCESATPPRANGPRRRYAYVGTGGRVRMFLDPVATRFTDAAEIVGLCDASLVRASYHARRLQSAFGHPAVPVYGAGDFERMLRETRPDVVIVCTIDSAHDTYIVAALRAGCDVITEKPMTISADKCAGIFAAVRETGRSVRVAFNYRWSPGATKVRELLAADTIGPVRHVAMEYLLNTSHGADYFRRWHSRKECSGGLLVHKSTHHFDLINWWVDAIPAQVFAHGALAFYGRANAMKRGDERWTRYPRYLGQAVNGDPFRYDYTESMLNDVDYERNLYLGAAEQESGYVRDQNVFRDDITIEDTMNVLVRYRSGALLSYSLNAYSPYEGYRVAFTGDRGRIEYREWHGAHIPGSGRIGAEHTGTAEPELRVFPHFKEPYSVALDRVEEGGHGGADPRLQRQIFAAEPPPDLFGRIAGHEQGAASILVGIAANRSIAEARPVNLSELVSLPPAATRLSELV